MQRLQRPWWWPWAALPVVALFGLATMLSVELDVFVLTPAGVLALVALRRTRERPTSGPQHNPTSWVCREVLTSQNPALFPSLAVGMTTVSGELPTAADLPPQPSLETAGRPTRLFETATMNECVAIAIPEDGFTAGAVSGCGWACRCGFKSARERFVAIGVPEDAYLNAAGDRWQCERVFADIQSDRVAVTLPVNAHSDYRGKGGNCDNAFRKQQDPCPAP